MSTKNRKLDAIAVTVMGILLGALLVTPPCHAGGAAILVPAENSDIPAGSNLPEHRTKALEKKVKELRTELKRQAKEKNQQQAPQGEVQQPAAPQK